MAEVVLFHHVLGLTAGVIAFADELRRHGHVVHTPDLFDGRTFADIDSGVAHLETIGFDTFVDQGVAAADAFPSRVVYAGISLGVLPAQRLAQTRPDAQGALFLEACAPMSAFGDGWPAGVAVQIHGMSNDPFFAGEGDIDNARAIVEHATTTTSAELFVYDGDQHLFTDNSLPSHHPTAAALVTERAVAFLAAR
jgi:dienelactone hydrolase